MRNRQIPVRKELPDKAADNMTVSIDGYKFKGREIHGLTELLRQFLEDDTVYEININIKDCKITGEK